MASSRSPRRPAPAPAPLAPAPASHEAPAPSAAVDPRIVAEVERVLEGFRSSLPPDALAALREDMLDFATTHPSMKDLWDRARPRPVPASSGVVPTGKRR